MVKFLKPGKVVIILSGRYAGKKAIIVKTYDDGTKGRKFGHALVVGISRAPLKVTKSMGKQKILKRSKVKPFVKFVNLQHLMPTRYSVDIDVKSVVNASTVKSPEERSATLKAVKQLFEQRYLAPTKRGSGAGWFFEKLRF